MHLPIKYTSYDYNTMSPKIRTTIFIVLSFPRSSVGMLPWTLLRHLLPQVYIYQTHQPCIITRTRITPILRKVHIAAFYRISMNII